VIYIEERELWSLRVYWGGLASIYACKEKKNYCV